MHASDLALVRGAAGTRATLLRWNARPGPVLVPWLFGAFAVTVCLLAATWIVATSLTPGANPMHFPGVTFSAGPEYVGWLVGRNMLVLALHGFACVAGYIAGSTLPRQSARYGPRWRAFHDHAGRFAMAFVAAATLFSLFTQTYALGFGAATLSDQFGLTPTQLLVGVLPHAIPELTALFLPLAAWLIASRRGEWDQLMAATVVTVSLAVPVLFASALIECYVSPGLLKGMMA